MDLYLFGATKHVCWRIWEMLHLLLHVAFKKSFNTLNPLETHIRLIWYSRKERGIYHTTDKNSKNRSKYVKSQDILCLYILKIIQEPQKLIFIYISEGSCHQTQALYAKIQKKRTLIQQVRKLKCSLRSKDMHIAYEMRCMFHTHLISSLVRPKEKFSWLDQEIKNFIP